MKNIFPFFRFLSVGVFYLFSYSYTFAQTTQTQNTLIQPYNQNAFVLYQSLSKDQNNILISPYGLLSLINTLHFCTQGKAKEEIQTFLKIPDRHLSDFIFSLNEWNHKLTQTSPCQKGIRCLLTKHFPFLQLIAPSLFQQPIFISNAIWFDQSIQIKPDFQTQISKLKDYYFFPIDFKNNPKKSENQINQWVNKQTQTQISNLLANNSISNATQVILTQTILFHNNWEKPFNPRQTRLEVFHDISSLKNAHLESDLKNSKMRILMMHNHGKIPYFENEKIKFISLPYQHNQQSFIGILPKEGFSLSDIEEQLNDSQLNQWLNSTKLESVYYSLPKIHIHYRYTNWIPLLEKLGVRTVFSNQADFSPLTHSRLQISQIIHETDIKFDENGTQASAASAAILVGATFSPPKKMEFNRPFIFLIIDQETKTILFMGKFVSADNALKSTTQ